VNKGILVIGLGKSGLSAAMLAYRNGIRVYVTEKNRNKNNEAFFIELDKIGIAYEVGNTDTFFEHCDCAVISPGIDPRLPYVCSVRERMPIISELEFAYRFFKPNQKMIGITGTNGKSTTTTLIYEILKAQGLKTALTGNIGIALCDHADKDIDYFVCEISSYQLEAIEKLRCETALITNITPDHLNRYTDGMSGYVAAKKRVYENQKPGDILVVNAENDITRACASDAPGMVYQFHKTEPVAQGAYVMGGMIVMRESNVLHEIVRTAELALPGAHNLENVLGAVASVWRYVTDIEALRKVLRTFSGIEHRLEFVADIKGRRFINDSKGTNVDSTEKALVSFPERPIVVILGGDDAKKSDFSPLVPLIKAYCRTVVLIGKTRPVMREMLTTATIVFSEVETMTDAVRKGYSLASDGDIVLLSPACASFDMFDNFEHRGQVFKDEVMKLKAEHGIQA